MKRRRRTRPEFTVEYATLPPRTPRRDKRKAKREARDRGEFDAPRRQREPLEDAPRLKLTRWW
jgi:hypothetical protein